MSRRQMERVAVCFWIAASGVALCVAVVALLVPLNLPRLAPWAVLDVVLMTIGMMLWHLSGSDRE